jgi:hypothetical protein
MRNIGVIRLGLNSTIARSLMAAAAKRSREAEALS